MRTNNNNDDMGYIVVRYGSEEVMAMAEGTDRGVEEVFEIGDTRFFTVLEWNE